METNEVSNWEIHHGFLNEETCDILEEHFNIQKQQGNCRYGNVNGYPQGNCYDLYGDSFCEAIGVYKTEQVSRYAQTDVSLTYGLLREYEKGAGLTWHRDRWQCKYSVTIQLTAGAWPLDFAETYIGGLWVPDSSVILQRGDALFYKGCEIYHSRQPLKIDRSRHLLLHYVEKGSALDKKDNRPQYGRLHQLKAVKGVQRVEATAYNKNSKRERQTSR